MRVWWVLRRLRGLGPRRTALVCEAFVCLVAAKVALRWVPVRFVLDLVKSRGGPTHRGKAAMNGASRASVEEVRWAVAAVARSSPVRFVCFPQCVAGSLMLSRRGVGSVLHYGVARGSEGLRTHTWLQVGETVVIGEEVREEFTLLQSF